MKQLATLTLPDRLVWSDEYHATAHHALEHTLDGSPVFFVLPRERSITLTAGEGSVWLDGATVAAVLELAALPHATYPLTWEGQTFTVAFRHHHHPAVEMVPIWPHADRFAGTIRLMVL